MRERVYKIAMLLTVVFMADGIVMAIAYKKGGYSPLGYAQVFYIPIFMPAFLAALIVTGIYIHRVARRAWVLRKSEWLFFVLLVVAVAEKLIFRMYS